MPPKRVRSGTVSAAAATAFGNKAWETGLTAAPFEEETWRASISLVVGERLGDEELISALQLAVQQSLRRLFSVITWDATLEKIHELGNPKVKKTKDAPMFYEVMEAAKALLDAGEELPCDLLGKLLKFQLLGVKAGDQQRRATEMRDAEEKDMTKAGNVSPTKDRAGAKPVAKGDKGKKVAEPIAPAKETKLKKRGEKDDTHRYIDDEPDSGPEHYILVVGFHQAQLVYVLDTLGVHVSNVIKLTSVRPDRPKAPLEDSEESEAVGQRRQRELDQFWCQLEGVLNRGSVFSKLCDVARLSHTTKETLMPQDKGNTEAMLGIGTGLFEEVACLIYDSLDWRRQHQHYLNNTRLVQVPSVTRAEACNTQENPAETVQTPTPRTPGPRKRQAHEETTAATEPETDALTTDVDMRYYKDLLDQIPPEASSVPLILHCMLDQVVATEQDIAPLSAAGSEKGVFGLEKSLVDYMLSAFMSLPRSDHEKKTIRETFGAVERSQQVTECQRPLLISCHDERALRLHHLPVHNSFDAVTSEAEMMRNTRVWNLLRSVRPLSGNASRLARIQELTHYCTDEFLSWPEVERLFSQFVFESMPLTQVDESGLLMAVCSPQPACLPWVDPVCFVKWFQGREVDHNLSSVMAVTDIQKCRLRSLRDWHYAEHHDSKVFPQILQTASQSYECMDSFCGSQDNTLFLVCHNPMNSQRQCKELWEVSLHTDVGFRMYLEHVAESISDWTREEEAKWQFLQAKSVLGNLRGATPLDYSEKDRTDSAVKKGTVATSSGRSPMIPEEDPPDQHIREDSLKAWKIEQERLKEEQMKKTKKDKGGKAGGSAKRVELADSSREHKKTPSSMRKSREDVSKTPDPVLDNPVDESTDLQSPSEAFAGFTGYGVDGQLIQVSGQVESLHPSDGGRIQVETIHFVQGPTLLKVSVTKDKHHFCTHITQPIRVLDDRPKETQCAGSGCMRLGSFSAVLDDGMHLSYSHYGPTGEHGSSLSTVPSDLLRKKPQSSQGPGDAQPPRETHETLTNTETRVRESPVALPGNAPFQALSISTPSGLLLQFLRDDTAGGESAERDVMVRQSFPLHRGGDGGGNRLSEPSLNGELSRVITAEGSVVKCMRDGSIQVLFADGSVSTSPGSRPVMFPPHELPAEDEELLKDSPTPEAKDRKGKLSSRQSMGADPCQIDPEPREDQQRSGQAQGRQGASWITTTPSGYRVATIGGQTLEPSPVLAFRATDPVSQTVVITREDKVLSVLDRDGTVIVDHADGTRITTLYQEREARRGWSLECLNTARRPSSSVCRMEKVVTVERPGFATVAMFTEGRTCSVFFGDSTVVTATRAGAYHVYPSSVGLLWINPDGSTMYASEPEGSPEPGPAGWSSREWPGCYVMKHAVTTAADKLCEVTDHHGNHFQVMGDGQTSVEISSALNSSVDEDEDVDEGDTEGELAKHVEDKVHSPRFFMAHEDGSGTELLYSRAVEEDLDRAYADPTVALLKEPLPDRPGVLGITVLRPARQDVWSRWVIQKQNKDIMPANLKSRNWENFPSVERKTPGPPFGTTLGRGLTLKEKPGSEGGRAVPCCPDVLEVRQLLQYRPVSGQLRSTLDTRLKEYMEQVMRRESLSEEMQLKDPRSEEEKLRAVDLLKLVLSERPSTASEKSPDVAALYIHALTPPALQTEASVSEKDIRRGSDGLSESRWKSRMEQHRRDLEQAKLYRHALRNVIIPPYFHSENGPGFESSGEVPDMRALSQSLPPFPKTTDTRSFIKDAPEETDLPHRPLNPRPPPAAGSDARPVGRATNPSSQPAGDSFHAVSTDRRRRGDVEPGSAQLNVAGNPRTHRVKLPSSILSSKPCSTPNQQFLRVEEPVRRKVKTVSVTGGQKRLPRGFELLPVEVQFGALKEGCTYSVTVLMKNVGFDTCRFSVKQPSPGTGLRVIYSPGPVAAGMKTELQVELYAMATDLEEPAEGEAYVSHQIHIRTESEILYLPVSATILPERLYDSRTRDHTNGAQMGVSKVRLISSNPPVRRGVVLPYRPLIPTTGKLG
ncbi:sperm-associated antigen 17 [Esox lucius]|nr:sperm-associated antigen 17 [Esox lucius]